MMFNSFKKKKESGCGCEPAAPVAKEVPAQTCGCGCDCSSEDEGKTNPAENQDAMVKVLGPGCKKCNELEANTKEALTNLGMDSNVGHVSDFAEIAGYGVMNTPALVVDGKVVSTGKVLKTSEIEKIVSEARK